MTAPVSQKADIAIIGMACLFPLAPDLTTYWQNIIAKVDAIGDPPAEWEAERFFDPDSHENDRIYTKRGGYLQDLALFNPVEYGIIPLSVEGGAPDHFLGLKVAHEALLDAGFRADQVDRSRVEIILGRGTYINRGYTNLLQHGMIVNQTLQIIQVLHPEYGEQELAAIKQRLKQSLPPFNADVCSGMVPNIVTGRIANRLDFMGPNFLVDAACASSLIAIDLGIQDLRAGRCDMAVVGGVHASTPPQILMIFCQLNALSRRRQLRPFDELADGTLLGEGIGILVLKRLADAERDGDRIYALIKGVGTASDGRAVGLLTPRVEGEVLAIRRAYEDAGISPGTVELIEAHGTGTPVGDEAEIQALSSVFGSCNGRAPRCALGSVKSMIGHTIPAAGAAGVIKAAMALYHKVLPPTLCDSPSSKLKLEETPFYLNTEPRPWIHGLAGAPRRAGVNAFGFGGINAHVILEEYTGGDEAQAPSFLPRWPTELFILQEESRDGLLRKIEKLLQYVNAFRDVDLKDLAFSLNTQQTGGTALLAIVASTAEDLAQKLDYASRRLSDPTCRHIKEKAGVYYFQTPLGGQGGKIVFLFPGEGAQYVNMLSELCMHFPEVRTWFDLMDRVFVDHPRQYLPSQFVFPPSTGQTSLKREAKGRTLLAMDVGAEAVFAASLGLFDLLTSLGIRPDFVVGHSTGERSALLVAGALRFDRDAELISHILELNNIYEELSALGEVPVGIMLAVGGVGREVVEAVIGASPGPLHIAMDNCPGQLVLCGSRSAVEWASIRLAEEGAICMPLPVERAYHIPDLEPVCRRLKRVYDRTEFHLPTIPLYSCAVAEPMPPDPEMIRDLAWKQYYMPVRFRETIERLYSDGARIFLEVGPKGTQAGFVDDILRTRPHVAVATDWDKQAGITQLNHCLALLAAHHVPMQLDRLYRQREPRRLSLDAQTDLAVRNKSARRRAGEFRLDLSLPVLRLASPGQFSAFSTAPVRQETERGSADREPSIPEVEAPKPATPSIAIPDAPLAGAPQTGRAATSEVMQAYLKTMEEFLGLHEAVLGAYLKKQAVGQRCVEPSAHQMAAPSDVIRIPTTASKVVCESETHAGDVLPHFPMLGTITYFEAGKHLEAFRRLVPEEDVFLGDHAIGMSVSAFDSTLTGLQVLPLTMSMEMIAEAATALARNGRLIRMENVRTYRWIAVDRASVELAITARVSSQGQTSRVDVQIGEYRQNPKTRGPVIVEGTAVFGSEYPSAPEAGEFPLTGEGPSRWRPEMLYSTGMIHGPAFRAVVSVDRMGADGAEATLEVLPRDGLVRSVQPPEWVIDPILLDAGGQVVGYWAADHLTSGFSLFPFRLRALHLFGPLRRIGERLRCRLRIRTEGDNLTWSTIDFVTSDGHLHMRLEGWEDRTFDLPPKFFEARMDPRTAFLSQDCSAAVVPSDLAYQGVVCCLQQPFSEEFLTAHYMIWRRVLAHLILGRREREIWYELRGPDEQRINWLLGRIAAKDAVRRILKRRCGLDLYPADIEVIPDAYGRPCVEGMWTDQVGGAPQVSIAHAGGYAAAAARFDNESGGVGLDIEPLQPARVNTEALLDAFSEEEQRLLVTLGRDHDEAYRLAWCAKEAVAKAVGRGLLGNPLNVQVRRIDQATGTMNLELCGELAEVCPERSGTVIAAHTMRLGDLALAICCCGNGNKE